MTAFESRAGRWTRWAATLVVVVVAHAGTAAFSLWHGDVPAEPDPEGVFVVELAPITTTVAADAHDMAVGPSSEDSAAVSPVASDKPPPEAEDLPDLPPPVKAPDPPPELTLPEVAKKEPEKKQEEEKPKEEAKREPVAPSDASVAARPLGIEDTPVATKTAAPVAGTAKKSQRTRAKWQRDLVAYLGRFKTYPAAARNRRETGDIQLKFELDRSGRVTSAQIISGSGSPRLDAAALDMLKRASPLPPPPDQVPGTVISFIIPVQFHLRN
jgi:protein TonB